MQITLSKIQPPVVRYCFLHSLCCPDLHVPALLVCGVSNKIIPGCSQFWVCMTLIYRNEQSQASLEIQDWSLNMHLCSLCCSEHQVANTQLIQTSYLFVHTSMIENWVLAWEWGTVRRTYPIPALTPSQYHLPSPVWGVGSQPAANIRQKQGRTRIPQVQGQLHQGTQYQVCLTWISLICQFIVIVMC